MEIVTLLIGILLAVGVPLWVDWLKRPRLDVELGSNAERDQPKWRIVHVKIVNRPLQGWLGKFLLRETATGAQVWIVAAGLDGSRVEFGGKWSATPEPLTNLPAGGSFLPYPDAQKIHTARTLDLSPTKSGESVAVAIKHDGETEAYGFGLDLYVNAQSSGPLREDGLKLPAEVYVVAVQVEAGQIFVERVFGLKNKGDRSSGLALSGSVATK